MNDLVSVIIPIYNAELYIERCLNSIIKQTYDNIEIILLNDGSTDNSQDICLRYEKSDSRIKLISQSNRGVSEARNKGIELAKGKYIMFVDSDDYINKNMIEDMMQKIVDSDVDLVISGISMHFLKNKTIIKTANYNVPNKVYSVRQDFINDILNPVELICICGPCCKLYKNEILKNNKIRFNINLTMGEDTWYNLDYLSVCNGKIITINHIYYHYMRENSNSLYSKYYMNYIKTTEKVYDKFLKLMIKEANEQAIQRFEKMYAVNLIYANNINFKYHCSKEKKIEDIEYVLKNETVRKVLKKSKSNNFKERILFFLIKHKKFLYFYLSLKNFNFRKGIK